MSETSILSSDQISKDDDGFWGSDWFAQNDCWRVSGIKKCPLLLTNFCSDLFSIVSKVNSFYIGYSTNEFVTTASNQDKFHLPEKLEENFNINTLFKLIYFTCIR